MTNRDYLANFELIVMLALMRLREDAYGVPISREIEERIGRVVALASVYATLERLESKGLLSSELGEPTPERGGRARAMAPTHDPPANHCENTRKKLLSIRNRRLVRITGEVVFGPF